MQHATVTFRTLMIVSATSTLMHHEKVEYIDRSQVSTPAAKIDTDCDKSGCGMATAATKAEEWYIRFSTARLRASRHPCRFLPNPCYAFLESL